jgi:glycerol uptake facilitator-like aquaporin
VNRRAVLGEALGSFLLFATVIGSGIMAERLAGGNGAIALLGNTLATGAILFVLVTMLAPVSGAHLNPAVTLVMRLRGQIRTAAAAGYVAAQLAGGILGVWVAHVMFDLPVLQLSDKIRSGPGQWAGEAVATFGLLLTILGTARVRPASIPISVALYIVLYCRRLLVHLVDQLREPGDHGCARAEQQLRRYRAGVRARIHRGTACRCIRRASRRRGRLYRYS